MCVFVSVFEGVYVCVYVGVRVRCEGRVCEGCKGCKGCKGCRVGYSGIFEILGIFRVRVRVRVRVRDRVRARLIRS